MKRRNCPPCMVCSHDFPENQLGASLKHEQCVHCDKEVPHFPENQLGASLKLRGIATRDMLPRSLPREPTRGLIEARCLDRDMSHH